MLQLQQVRTLHRLQELVMRRGVFGHLQALAAGSLLYVRRGHQLLQLMWQGQAHLKRKAS
jgi:hypothetical protein